MIARRPKRVLFICIGNSVRSQMAEAIMRQVGGDRFEVVSAGTSPRKTVHPEALAVLRRFNVPATGLVPKDVANMQGQTFNYVISLCERAREQCPVFPGAETMEWSFADPSAIADDDKRPRAFEDISRGLTRRIQLLVLVDERT